MSTPGIQRIEVEPPPETDFRVDIGEDDIAFYREHGYLVCGEMSTPEELEWLVGVYDRLLEVPRSGFPDAVFDLMRPYGSLEPARVGQMLFPERRVPELRQTSLWKNAQRAATKLLGENEASVQNWGHIIYKSPDADNITPWHQDEAYWDVEYTYNAIGGWAPLQDVDETNGCMWFIPGSHKGKVRHHRHFGDDPAVHILQVTEDIDTSTAVPVPLPAGAMTFHHPRMLHFASPNHSQSIRRAWANEFQTAPIKRDVPADHPWVLEGQRAMSELHGQR